jgi:hypothetical protein
VPAYIAIALVAIVLLYKILTAVLGMVGVHFHVAFPWSHGVHVTQSITTYQDPGPMIVPAVENIHSVGGAKQNIPITRVIQNCKKVAFWCATTHTLTYKATGVAPASIQIPGDAPTFWDSPYGTQLHHYWYRVVKKPSPGPNGTTNPGKIDLTLVLPAVHMPGSLTEVYLLPDNKGYTYYVLDATHGGVVGHGVASSWGNISHDDIAPDALKFTLAQIHRPELWNKLLADAKATATNDVTSLVKLGAKLSGTYDMDVHVTFASN